MEPLLLSCYLGCSGLLSVGSFSRFQISVPLDEPKPGNPFVLQPFLSARCDTAVDPSHRAYLGLFLSPSLPSELIRGQWAGKKNSRGGKGGGPSRPRGLKGALQQAGVDCRVGNRGSVFSEAHGPDRCGNNGTIIGCTYSCSQRIDANEVLTRARLTT